MSNLDRVNARLTKVNEVCATLYQSLKEFEVIVLKENDAIGRSDLAELEGITDDKVLFGDRTSKTIQALQDAMDNLGDELGDLPRKTREERQLSHFVDHVEGRLRAEYPELETAIKQLVSWSESLKDLRTKIFAQVETNAYLVQRLLDYHRETYAFWQAVARDSESGYGKTGKTKYGHNGPSKSLLTVRT